MKRDVRLSKRETEHLERMGTKQWEMKVEERRNGRGIRRGKKSKKIDRARPADTRCSIYVTLKSESLDRRGFLTEVISIENLYSKKCAFFLLLTTLLQWVLHRDRNCDALGWFYLKCTETPIKIIKLIYEKCTFRHRGKTERMRLFDCAKVVMFGAAATTNNNKLKAKIVCVFHLLRRAHTSRYIDVLIVGLYAAVAVLKRKPYKKENRSTIQCTHGDDDG